MKRHLVWILAAFGLVLVAPSAFATRVIFDPPLPSSNVAAPSDTDCTQSSGSLNNYTPCNVSEVNTPYTITFVNCSTLSGISAQGWCLYMTNVTGGPLNTFRFQTTVPDGGSLDGSDLLQCSSLPPGFATDNCTDGAMVTAGQLLDVTFFALLPNNTNFYLITDFLNQPAPATVTVSVPEPGQLGLFGLGLLALGVAYGWQRRRRNH